ncbi:MAG: PEP-CTERM sorting domain-containing protein [Planctomycetaceae bacterium]
MGRTTYRMIFAFLTVFTLLEMGLRHASAGNIAVNIRSNGFMNGADYNIGWEFSTNSSIMVTELGWFDRIGVTSDPGFASAHTIAIFSSNGDVLVSASVSPGTVNPIAGLPVISSNTDEIRGYFRYVEVTPTVLTAGQSYIISGTNPLEFPDPFAVGFSVDDDMTVDSDINFVQGRMSSLGTGSSLVFPTEEMPVDEWNGRNFGPNFQFVPVPASLPEPSSVLLLALGGGLCLWRRQRN